MLIDRAQTTACCESQTTSLEATCTNPNPYRSVISAASLARNGCAAPSLCGGTDQLEFACSDTVDIAWTTSPSTNPCDTLRPESVRILNPDRGIKPAMNLEKRTFRKCGMRDVTDEQPPNNVCGDDTPKLTCWTSFDDPRLRTLGGDQIYLDAPVLTGSVAARNIYSQKLAQHQLGYYRGYTDIAAGSIQYYVPRGGSVNDNSPNRAITSDVVTQVYRDPMGRVTTQKHRTPLTKDSRYLLANCLDFGSQRDQTDKMLSREHYVGAYADQLSRYDYTSRGDESGCDRRLANPLSGLSWNAAGCSPQQLLG